MFEAVADADAFAVLEHAWNAGLRFFDTAPLYGMGLAEQRLGVALKGRPRDAFTLATKVGRVLRAGNSPESDQFWRGVPALHPVFDFTYDGVMRSVEESLQRLGLERVDLLHLHDPDDHFEEALNGAYPALDRLRSEGLVGALGAGMNQAEMLVRFAKEADFDCFLLAGRYTLLDQIGLRELLPLCLDRGIAIIAGGVYNSGILADPRPGAAYNYMPAPPELLDRARRLRSTCERHGVPLKAAALQFPLGHPAVAAVLSGSRSTAELEENLSMFRLEIPSGLWAELRADGLLPIEAPTP